MTMRLLPTLFTLSFLYRVSAQSANAVCLPFYDWASNSEKQGPCQVASSLLSVCNGGTFPVIPLPSNTVYLGPTLQNANPCQCNTVTYSLMSACAACQGKGYLSWSVWSANCATVYPEVYPEPIPLGVSVPGWAYLNVEASDNFDQTNARKNINLTESTAMPSPTSSTTTVQPTLSSSSTTKSESSTVAPSSTATVTSPAPTATGSSDSSDDSDSQANTVGGSVVGGLAGAALIFGLLGWYIYHRKRAARNGVTLSSPTSSNNPSWHGQGPYMAQVHPPPPTSGAPSSTSSVDNQAQYHRNMSSSGLASSVPAGTVHAV